MEKKTLYFKADNQSLVGQNVPARLASDTVSYIEVVFDLGENWSGFDAVKAVWSTDFDSLCTVLDSSGACVVPHEVLERVGDVWVNLVGSISEDDTLTDRLTTYPIKAVVVDANAAVCGSETSPITPSQFDQFVEAVRADADRAEEGATAAAASASAAATSAAWSDERATDSSNAAYIATNARAEAERWANEANRAQYYAWQEAENAGTSARDAEEAKNTILSMTATATTLPEGSQATVDYSNGVMAFGIPRGDKGAKGDKGETGETGATPQMSIGTVETLEPDEDATATITGTAEAPVLNLGLPKGDTGEVSLLELIANTKVDEVSDSVPYQKRTLSGVGSHESMRKIVGGTVGLNQLANNDQAPPSRNGVTFERHDDYFTMDGTATSLLSASGWFSLTSEVSKRLSGHKVLVDFQLIDGTVSDTTFVQFHVNGRSTSRSMLGTRKIIQCDASTSHSELDISSGIVLTNVKARLQVIDLTQMFGSTIADYIYSLEQATAGAGVAWFRSLFPEDYYPYDAGTLKSVQTSAHKTYDADGNVIGNYPLDSSLTLRGIPKLVDGKLTYDGDEYPPNGEINRRYSIVDLGTLTYNTQATGTNTRLFYGTTSDAKPSRGETVANAVSPYAETKSIDSLWVVDAKGVGISGRGSVAIRGDILSPSDFKASLSGTMLVYELATPTTETATAYTELQEVESGGSEEFVGAEIPVGHESTYPRTLADTMPTADGSYTLSLTVSGGKPKVEWEVNA